MNHTKRAAPAPTDAAQSRTAAKPLDYAQSNGSRRWAQISERRRASRELDRLLGVPSRPNIELTYSLRSSLEDASRLPRVEVEHEASCPAVTDTLVAAVRAWLEIGGVR